MEDPVILRIRVNLAALDGPEAKLLDAAFDPALSPTIETIETIRPDPPWLMPPAPGFH